MHYFTSCAHTITTGIVITWVVCDIGHCVCFANWRSEPWLLYILYIYVSTVWLPQSVAFLPLLGYQVALKGRVGLKWRTKVYSSAKFKEPLSQLNGFYQDYRSPDLLLTKSEWSGIGSKRGPKQSKRGNLLTICLSNKSPITKLASSEEEYLVVGNNELVSHPLDGFMASA